MWRDSSNTLNVIKIVISGKWHWEFSPCYYICHLLVNVFPVFVHITASIQSWRTQKR